MSSVMDRIREAATIAAAGPLAGDRERPRLERVAARSPFPLEAGLNDYVERFRTELEALSSNVYGPLDAEGAAETAVRLIQERGAFRVLTWDESQIGCPALRDQLEQAAIEIVSSDVPNDEEHQAVLERLAEIEVGLTGATAGLADTGSIVVASGPGRARIASLLPPVHIAVLPLSKMYPTMQAWLAAGGAELAKGTSNLVVITGGSRTSDIELQLTLGMHGPRELHVVLYRD